MKFTHDRRPIYPHGSPLPEGASGFTQCRNQGGAYAVWLKPEDRERSKADYLRIAREVNALKTKCAVKARCEAEGVRPSGTLRDMRIILRCHLYAKAWPLVEANTP